MGAMSGPPPTSGESSDRDHDDERDAEVLGRLPRSRPAVRSPRRAARQPEPPLIAAAEGDEAEERRGHQAEVEALARAGVSLAGEAASLGFRAAGRAAAALRSAVERR